MNRALNVWEPSLDTGNLWGNDLISEMFSDPLFQMSPVLRPTRQSRRFSEQPTMQLDVIEKEDCCLVFVDVPGVDKDSIDIRVEGNILTVSVKKPEHVMGPNDRCLRCERGSGTVERRIQLPRNCCDSDAASVKYENGCCILSFPKVKSEGKKLRIR